uniref:F-box domain-containing protein n=3 Tax=Aegilops tauschii subsp. strangulata TaxID=200361 RepID=A0A453DYS3_AEGTS
KSPRDGMEEMSWSAASLPEELLVEILARVPYRSLCRFRCVSPSWRALCSDPGLVRRSLQTLSGFFCHALHNHHDVRFLNFPGGSSGRRPLVDPSFPFLRGGGYTHGFILVDCSGGLLCGCFTSPTPSSSLDIDYLVCNPATEEWTVLPRTQHMNLQSIIRLGFDPDDPCGFTVFLFEQDLYDGGTLTGLKIYSSETRTWASKQIGWSQGIHLDNSEESVSVFMNGVLHLHLPANNTLIVTWTWTARLGRHFGGHPLVMASGGLKDACTL